MKKKIFSLLLVLALSLSLLPMEVFAAVDGIPESGYIYTIANSAPDFASQQFKPRTTMAINDFGRSVYFKIMYEDGQELSNEEYEELTFSALPKGIVTISEKLDSDRKLSIEPITVGSVQLLLKNGNGTNLALLPIEVGPAHELANLIIDNKTVTVQNAGDSSLTTVGVKAIDNFNDNIDAQITATKKNSNDPDILTVSKTGDGTANLQIDASGVTPGQYVYTVSAESADRKFSKDLTIIVTPLLCTTVTYVDEFGKKQTADAVLLTEESQYISGWVYVNSDLTFRDHLVIAGDANIIIGGGCTLVANIEGYNNDCRSNVAFFKSGNGVAKWTGSFAYRAYPYNLTLNNIEAHLLGKGGADGEKPKSALKAPTAGEGGTTPLICANLVLNNSELTAIGGDGGSGGDGDRFIGSEPTISGVGANGGRGAVAAKCENLTVNGGTAEFVSGCGGNAGRNVPVSSHYNLGSGQNGFTEGGIAVSGTTLVTNGAELTAEIPDLYTSAKFGSAYEGGEIIIESGNVYFYDGNYSEQCRCVCDTPMITINGGNISCSRGSSALYSDNCIFNYDLPTSITTTFWNDTKECYETQSLDQYHGTAMTAVLNNYSNASVSVLKHETTSCGDLKILTVKESGIMNTDFHIEKDTVVDLNGFEVKADKKFILDNGGKIIDSTGGKGILKLPEKEIYGKDFTEQFLLYDSETNGYRIFECELKAGYIEGMEDTIGTTLSFKNAAVRKIAKRILAGENPGVTVNITITQTDEKGIEHIRTVDVPQSVVQNYANGMSDYITIPVSDVLTEVKNDYRLTVNYKFVNGHLISIPIEGKSQYVTPVIEDDTEECEINTIGEKIETEEQFRELLTGGGVGYLAGDITINSTATIKTKANVQFCLNGNVLNLNGKSPIVVYDGAVLNLYDCKETEHKFGEADGTWIFDDTLTGDDVKHTVNGGCITGGRPTSGGAVYLNSGGTFNMYGGNIVGNEVTENAGGVYAGSGIFNLHNGRVIGNKAIGNGGGIYVSNGEFNMFGGEVTCNISGGSAGGVYSKNKVVLFGGNITRNKSGKSGGAMYLSGASVIMHGGNIAYNETAAERYGGGMYLDTSTLQMDGGSISNNTSYNSGGGVYINAKSSAVMNGGTISKNKSMSDFGGGVYVTGENAHFEMYGGEITENSAKRNGGGIYCNGATVNLGGTAVVKNNILTKNANNVRNYNGTLSISETTPPAQEMIIGLHGGDTVVANAHPGDERYFFEDDSAKVIVYFEGSLITVDSVSAIGSRGYASVVNAIAVAKKGDTIKLLADNSESFVLPVNVSFNTNGKNYTGIVSAPDYCKIEQNGNIYIVVYKGLIIEDEEAVFADSTNLDDNDKQVILDELLNNNAIENNNIDEVDGVSKLVTELKKVEATKDDNGEVIVDKVIYDVTPKNENGEEVHEPSGPITFSLPVPQSWESWEYDASQVEFRHYFLSPNGVEFIDKGVIPISDGYMVQCKFWCFSTIELTPHMHTFTGDYVDNGDGTHSCKCSDCGVLNNSENHTDANVDNICDKCGTVINKTIPTFTGMSLTLGSDISINFYMELSEEARQNGTMTFNIGGRIVTVKGTDAKYNEKEKKYYFQTPLTALEMNETVIATFNYNGVDYIQEYSVADYIEEIVGNENKYGEKAVALAKKIANYGHYAQTYLASIHKNVVIGDDGYAEMYKCGDVDIKVADAKTALENYKVTVTGELDNLSLYGSTVYFDSATALNYYVTVKDGVAPTATAVNTKTDIAKDVEIKLYKDKIYIVSIKDITATELADDIEVTINGEITLTGSVFAYCNSVVKAHDIDGATDKDIVAINAMAAFYEYHKAAVEYAETQD